MLIGLDYKSMGPNRVQATCTFTAEEFGEIMMKATTHEIRAVAVKKEENGGIEDKAYTTPDRDGFLFTGKRAEEKGKNGGSL